LVSIDSEAEADFVFSNIDEWFWTGGHFSNGEWTWRDGTLVRSRNWFSRQPSNKGAGSCRAVQIFSTLAMSPCRNPKKFICEREASTAVGNSNAPSGNSNTRCPAGWKNKFGHCYKWFFNAAKTWQEAEDDCNEQYNGAHLISIHDDAENEFISKTLFGTVWTGARKLRRGRRDGWGWSDRTPWDYFGTTMGLISRGECATTFRKSAFEFDCNETRLYICKK